jgi:REP element-mobilizing transposase RayT
MATTHTALHIHLVFSTKNRERWLHRKLEKRVWSYLAGIAVDHRMRPFEIGGVEDHIHALLGIPATMAASRAAQLLKGGSSYWIHEAFPDLAGFAWQNGYGAFSVSKSNLDEVAAYIRNQRGHHRTRMFKEEYIQLLERHGIEYDEADFLD